MKKIFLPIILLAVLLTACSSGETSLENGSGISSISSNNELSNPDIGSENNFYVITDGVYAAYDRSKYDNISAPKIYYADYQEIEEKTFLDLFSSTPEYSEEIKGYLTDTERGFYSFGKDKPRFYNMSYSTTAGTDCHNFGYEIFSNYSTAADLDFMTLNEMKNDLVEFTNGIFKTGIEITAYALSKKGTTLANGKKTPENWNAADEFYYIIARQSIDGVPIFVGVVGGAHKGGYTYGNAIESIYTENGMEFITIMKPYKIKSEAPITNEFITLTKAEEIIKGMYENLLTFDEVTFLNAELVYIPVYSSGELMLTPAWEFSDDFGPLYRINAYTGEEIR